MGGDALQRLLYLLMMQTAMILLMSEGIPRGLSFLLFAGSFSRATRYVVLRSSLMVGETSPLAMMVKNLTSTLTSILHCSPLSIDRLYKPVSLMKMSRDKSSSGPGAFPQERRERISMILFGERVKRPLWRVFDLTDYLLYLRGPLSVRFREGGWRS